MFGSNTVATVFLIYLKKNILFFFGGVDLKTLPSIWIRVDLGVMATNR